jgi:hypothetical protein
VAVFLHDRAKRCVNVIVIEIRIEVVANPGAQGGSSFFISFFGDIFEKNLIVAEECHCLAGCATYAALGSASEAIVCYSCFKAICPVIDKANVADEESVEVDVTHRSAPAD